MAISENMNSTNLSVIDMGNFSLDTQDKKKDEGMNFKKFSETKNHQDPIVKQAFKDTTRIMKKKSDEEIKEHQKLVLILVMGQVNDLLNI